MRRSSQYRLVCFGLIAALFLFSLEGLSYSASSTGSDPFAALQISRLSDSAPVAAFGLNSLDGQMLSSSDLAGKVVLLNFWATWCGPCKEEMPSLSRLQQHFDPQRFRVVTVTTDMHRQGIKQFLANLGIAVPVLFDEDQEVSRRFLVRGLPTTVLLGPDGAPVGRAIGPRAWDSHDAVALMQQLIQGAR